MIQKTDYICSTEYNSLQIKIGIILLNISMLMIWRWIQLNGEDLSRWIGEILGGVLGAFLIVENILQVIWTIQIFKNSNSYIRVYDDHVEGVTRVSFCNVDDENKAFSLQYNEILKAEISHGFIRIYTSSQNYEIMALENDSWALAEICKRISSQN